ncbi:MAG TPA: FixH family protein [Ignavibacteriaceae bacterium]|nr:FixH family protein [Ignavibacteriaceae bacterium]HRP92661.1 FixH family protein [Ignavibacteriaceae bacterium]HRQ54499.1 FixH family protein [Ignavibacteriaceae bacterium]
MSKSKFNWGTGILITIIIFMVITISTVIFLMNQKVDLVASDYYDKGIHHQEQIDRMNRTNKMGNEVSITPENGFIRLVLPKYFAQKSLNGTIQFYRPSDSKKDFAVALTIDTSAQQFISTQNMVKGYWKVKLNFTQDEVEYYKESSFVIN